MIGDLSNILFIYRRFAVRSMQIATHGLCSVLTHREWVEYSVDDA